jgi:hypothetical protein
MKKGHISKPSDWKLVPTRVLEKGIKIEYEHTKDYNTARRIATDHVMEMGPKYYDELEKLEQKLDKTKDTELKKMLLAAEKRMVKKKGRR